MTFKWDTIFETGIAIIDEQHKGLVDIINEAAPLLTSRGDALRGRLEVLIERLFDYAEQHFRTEEGLTRKHGLLESYQEHHHAIHQQFVDQLVELRTQMGVDPGGETGPSLLRFLTSWLTFHILDEDQRMARQIECIAAGDSPLVAYEKSAVVSQNDHVRAALVAALLDLYSVVGERNKTLHSTNEKLREMTRKLAENNRQLEIRVTERTAELSQSLETTKQAQGKLLQSEKMAAVGQLAAGVAHEINNPIGFVNSNLGSLKAYIRQLLAYADVAGDICAALPATDSRRQRFEQARQAADIDYLKNDVVELLDESEQGLSRVKKIVQDLKDFSHVDHTDWQGADLNAGLESTLNVVWSEIKYKAKVVRNYGSMPPVRCIAAQINQVFMNLLVNAAQAIDGQGTITLATGSGEGWVWIEVSDTGKGMSAEVKQRIFEPFYTTKPVGQGTGLGLSIAWDIVVKTHGGKLEVSSEPGRGSCFRIELPVKNNAARGNIPSGEKT